MRQRFNSERFDNVVTALFRGSAGEFFTELVVYRVVVLLSWLIVIELNDCEEVSTFSSFRACLCNKCWLKLQTMCARRILVRRAVAIIKEATVNVFCNDRFCCFESNDVVIWASIMISDNKSLRVYLAKESFLEDDTICNTNTISSSCSVCCSICC